MCARIVLKCILKKNSCITVNQFTWLSTGPRRKLFPNGIKTCRFHKLRGMLQQMHDYNLFRKDTVPYSCMVHEQYAGLFIYVTETRLAQDRFVNKKEFTEYEWHYAI